MKTTCVSFRCVIKRPPPLLLAVEQALVDRNEPPMPGKDTSEQAYKFAKALVRGQKDAAKIVKTIMEDQIREVV